MHSLKTFFTKLKRKVFRFSKTEFFSAFSTTTLTTGVQMVTGLAVNKIIAVTIGPAGIAFVGQFINFKTLITNLASGSFGQGVTKYVADAEQDTKAVIATSNIFSLFASLVIAILIILFAGSLSDILLKDAQYKYIFYLFGLLLPLFALNTLLLATVNGFRNFKVLAYLKITNNVVGLILSVALVLSFNLHGALVANALNTSVVFLVSLVILHYYFSISELFSLNLKSVDYKLLKKLLAFTLMALTSAQLKPFVQLYIRNYIIQNGGEFDAGIWQAMVHLSKHYLNVITAALGVYYLPKLSSLNGRNEIRKEIFSGMKTVLSGFLILAVVVFIARNWIIIILYSKDFMEMNSLFFPQLVGDFFMLFSFCISYLLLAKAMVKVFMVSQIAFSAINILLSILLFQAMGVTGIIWANSINYFLYSIFVVIIFRKILFSKP